MLVPRGQRNAHRRVVLHVGPQSVARSEQSIRAAAQRADDDAVPPGAIATSIRWLPPRLGSGRRLRPRACFDHSDSRLICGPRSVVSWFPPGTATGRAAERNFYAAGLRVQLAASPASPRQSSRWMLKSCSSASAWIKKPICLRWRSARGRRRRPNPSATMRCSASKRRTTGMQPGLGVSTCPTVRARPGAGRVWCAPGRTSLSVGPLMPCSCSYSSRSWGSGRGPPVSSQAHPAAARACSTRILRPTRLSLRHVDRVRGRAVDGQVLELLLGPSVVELARRGPGAVQGVEVAVRLAGAVEADAVPRDPQRP